MQQRIRIIAGDDEAGQRADTFLSVRMGNSRSFVARLIKENRVLCNGNPIKAKYIAVPGDVFEVEIPTPKVLDLQPWDTELDIPYQDEHLAVINKPRGMVVHPAPGNEDRTLVNALICGLDNLSGINGELRPGIVHRLDKNTTGLLVVAKDDRTHNALADDIRERRVRREYLALVEGNFTEESGVVNAPIGRNPADRKLMAVVENGREALTGWQVEHRYGDKTLLRCKLETGRTHQIRVHMKYINHPVVGDPEYGPKKDRPKAKGQLLHSAKLCFTHPISGEEMRFEAELPEDFAAALRRLDQQM